MIEPLPLPPGYLLLLGAPILAVLRGLPRKVFQLAIPLLAVTQVLALATAELRPAVTAEWMGFTLELLQVDPLRLVFGLVFSIMAVLGSLYSLHVEDWLQNAAAWVYAGASLGVTFSGDLLSLVLFWELMAVGSVMLVVSRRTRASLAAAVRYVAVHGLGGALLLMGVVAWLAGGNSPSVGAIPESAGLAGWLLLAGVAVNAAVPPLGGWLPDAYGEATLTGSVTLSAYTTKTAVLVLLLLFPGWNVLLWGGVAMALYGSVYGVMENNLRRLLAYSIVSQVGYMVAATGMGTALALDGAAAHAFSHILYKALLFMAAGAILHATGKEKLSELGGLARAMPLTLGLYVVGAASISGLPPFNGFISKSMVVSAAGEGGWPWAEIGLTVASVGTFLHTGLRVTYFGFLAPAAGERAPLAPLPRNMLAAMVAAAILCTLFGLWPGLLYRWLPLGTEYHPYTLHHVLQSVQLLAMAGLAFWLWRGRLRGVQALSLDADWLYRRPLAALALATSRGLVAVHELLGGAIGRAVEHGAALLSDPMRFIERLLGRGVLAGGDPEVPRTVAFRPPLGATILVVLLVFAAMAVLHLVGVAFRP